MKIIALYNMKGGVGKTTAAVNLSYLAAAAGRRTLLWDLDPQAAASFAFRIRPRVAGFGRRSLESGQALAAAIKATDFDNLDLLPADFTYRKLDRLLGHLGKPTRVVTELIETLGRGYDVVFLDCPAGFSLLTEGIFAAADVMLVPTIPTVLSLRTLGQLITFADRSGSSSDLAAFFSMVDRRKALHRHACDWSAGQDDLFLAGQVPYASVVEQMAVRRMPLAVFAARDSATMTFAAIWAELETRLQQRRTGTPRPRDRWALQLRAIESLMARLESEAPETRISHPTPVVTRDQPAAGDLHIVHTFDTDGRDIQRSGRVLELRERAGSFTVVAATIGESGDRDDITACVEVRIDGSWAAQILAGAMSPLAALERRSNPPLSRLLKDVRSTIGTERLRRLVSAAAHAGRSAAPSPPADTGASPLTTHQADWPRPVPSIWTPRRRAFGK